MSFRYAGTRGREVIKQSASLILSINISERRLLMETPYKPEFAHRVYLSLAGPDWYRTRRNAPQITENYGKGKL